MRAVAVTLDLENLRGHDFHAEEESFVSHFALFMCSAGIFFCTARSRLRPPSVYLSVCLSVELRRQR